MKINKKKLISGIAAIIGMVIMLVGLLSATTYATVIVIAVGWFTMCIALLVLEGSPGDAKVCGVVFIILVIMGLIIILSNGLDLNKPLFERQAPWEEQERLKE